MKNKYVKKTINLYKNLGWKYIFSYIRFWDAPIVEFEKYIPKKGNFVELGCGDGILSNYLAITSEQRFIHGIDTDKIRLKSAKRGLHNTKYTHGDIRKVTIPNCDGIIISHVLHHLSSYGEQEELLKICKNKLAKGGSLYILEIYKNFSIKYLIGWFFDHFLVPIFFEKRLYSKIYYRDKNGWVKMLNNIGLNTKVIPITKNKPISNIIILCKPKIKRG